MTVRLPLLALAFALSLGAAHAQTADGQAAGDDQIIVTAQKTNQTQVRQGGDVGVLGSKDGLDVPFNVRSYSASLILNQQSETLGQVLENDPSVRTTLGFGNFSEQFVIRGFPLFGDDVSIDGLYGVTPRQLVSPELYDSVQILNGASAFLNGAAPGGSGIGGGVNLEFKRAGSVPLTRITGSFRRDSLFGGGIDFGRRFGQDQQFGARTNVMARGGDTAINGEHHDATVAGGSVDWEGGRLRLSADFGYQLDNIDRGRPTVTVAATSVPRPPSPSHNYGQRWTYSRLRDIFGIASAEYDLADHVTLYAKAGARDGSEQGDYSNVTITDAAIGEGTAYGAYVPRTDNNESVQAGLRARFATGPIGHEINVGGSTLWEVNRNAYAFSLLIPFDTNIYDTTQVPRPVGNFNGGDLDDPFPIARTRLQSVYASDTLSAFDDQVMLVAGLRRQAIKVQGYSYADGSRNAYYNKSATTPVVGLIVKPTAHTSLYFNRIEGLAQGPSAPTTVTNPGEIFAPYRSTQYEVGGKYETARLAATLAFYRIEQPSAFTNAANAFVVDGTQRNQGIEFSLSGEPVHGLRVIGGATYIDATQRNTEGGLLDGKQAIGVPDYTVNANVEYDLPFVRGLTLTGRLTRTGAQKVDAANTLSIPAWTTVDLGGRYVLLAADKPITFRLGVDNVADRRYWASAFGGYLLQGGPRTLRLSASIDL